jgi:Flp pilus assembly protein TadG
MPHQAAARFHGSAAASDRPRRRNRSRGGRGRDDGSATLELVIAFPVLLLLIFSLVQASLYFYARSLALAAAQEGVRGARAESADLPDGAARARSFLTDAAGDSLRATIVDTGASTPTRIRVRVTGRSLSVLPGMPGLPVAQEASGPKERFTTAGSP